jgi:hypothetical protein
VNRDEVVKAIGAQPFDTDVQVDVGGFYIDTTRVRFDQARHSIVVELFEEDAALAMRHFFRAGRLQSDSGGSR